MVVDNVGTVKAMRRGIAIGVVAGLLAAPHGARAASITRTLTGTATIVALAKLSISPGSLSFPDSNPDTVPSVPASGGALAVTAKGLTTLGSTMTLTVLASDDFRSGVDTIGVAALTWSAAGSGFVSGTMSNTVAQTVGSWVNSGSRTGTQTYALANSWSYATGTYSMTLTYTLTAP